MSLQSLVHYGIHFALPLLIALALYKSRWKRVYIILALGMLIDLDHIIATPIFDPNRCSINFHPLHSYFAIALYVILLLPKQTRIIGLALCIHILADVVDCTMISH